MATGFDTRQGGRDTFASQGPAVQQLGRGTANADKQAVQRVGGDAVSGGAPNVQITNPGSGAYDLGQFMAKAFQPYVERRQHEQFFQGVAHAQAGESIEDLSKSHKTLVGKLFGPTAFEQGAEAFTGIQTVNKWEADLQDPATMDKMVRMTPEEQGKFLSDHSLSMMTKDPYVNQIVQGEIVKRTGPMLDTISKARFKYQQQQHHDTYFTAVSGAMDNLQTFAGNAAKVNDPADPKGMASVEHAADNMVGLLHPPEGMEVENYKNTVTDVLTSALQKGNFFAYKAAVSKGVLDMVGSDNQAKVLSAYDRYSKVGLSKATYDHASDAIEIAERMAAGEYKSPIAAAAAWHTLNATITQETGIDEPAYPADVLVGAGKGVIDKLVADMKQKATWEHEDQVHARDRAEVKADKIAEAAQKGNDARTAMAGGYTATGLATGAVDSTANNVAYLGAYKDRNFAMLSGNAARGYTSPVVQQQINSQLTSSHGQAYGGDQKAAYETWQQWSKADMNGAIQYYGTQNATRMMTMDRMIASGEPPSQAYLFAFADTDPTKYAPIPLSGHEMQTAQKAVDTAVDSQGSNFLGRMFGGAPMAMTKTTKSLLTNETFRDVGIMMRGGSHEPPEVLAGAAVRKALSDGHLEIHGGSMSWLNPANSQTMPTVTKMSPDSFRDSLKAVMEHKLKASGFTVGVDGEYDVQRIGNDLMVWSAADGKILHVTPQDIINEHHSHALRNAPTTNDLTDRAARDRRTAEFEKNDPIYRAGRAIGDTLSALPKAQGRYNAEEYKRLKAREAASRRK